MKKLLVSLLALTMAFSLVACGEDSSSDAKGDETKAVTTEAPTEAPSKATIGDVTLQYESAVMYKPYDNEVNKPNMLVYYTFTNNSSEAVIPSKVVYTKAKQGEKNVSTITYLEEAIPPEMNLFYKSVEPGATVKLVEAYQAEMESGATTVEFIDLYNQIEEKLVLTIDPADLELITESLAVPTTTP